MSGSFNLEGAAKKTSARVRSGYPTPPFPMSAGGPIPDAPEGWAERQILTLLYGPAVRCKLNVLSRVNGLAHLYPALSWSRSLLAIMDFRAHPISFSERP
jgi:hypothetical protein